YESEEYYPKKPYHALKKGITLVPGERSLEGIIVDFPVVNNLSMSAIPKKGPLIDKVIELENAKNI
ncbi:MAG: hypothetical protein ACYDG2_14495, partial [Ruminiclostridium sp.]